MEEAKNKRSIKFNYLGEGEAAFNCGSQIGLTSGRGTQAVRVRHLSQGMESADFAMECCAMIKTELSGDDDEEKAEKVVTRKRSNFVIDDVKEEEKKMKTQNSPEI